MIEPRAGSTPPGLLVRGAAEIVTMAGGLRRGSAQADGAVLTGGVRSLTAAGSPAGEAAGIRGVAGTLAIACWEGRIRSVGPFDDVLRQLAGEGLDGLDPARFVQLDARGRTLTPGLVDSHTHLVFAGSREGEIALRQRGASYLEILAAGGGILSTVAQTRAASTDELLAAGRRWLAEMLRHGATTVEVKSGYGLERASELRQLEVAARLGAEGPAEIVPTFLGAHAVAPEFRARPDAVEAYVDDVIELQLPAVAEQGIARFCDVFCEEGVFTAEQSRRVLLAGARNGLTPRLHADELRPSGGAELAAELGAASADHLGVPSQAGMDALARANEAGVPVVATLLPTTSLFLKAEEYGPGRQLIERGVPLALGTDFNPGTSPSPNLQLAISLGVLRLGLSPAEALAAVTINAAHALRLGDSHGSLEPGKVADLVVWDVPSHAQIPYWLGADLVRTVVKRGRVVFAA